MTSCSLRALVLLWFGVMTACQSPALVPVPLPRHAPGLVVEQQRVSMTCGEVVPEPQEIPSYPATPATLCSFSAEVAIRNQLRVPQIAQIELSARNAEHVIKNDQDHEVSLPLVGNWTLTEPIVLAAGEQRLFRTTGIVAPSSCSGPCLLVSPLAVRHPLLAWDSGDHRLSFALPPDSSNSRVDPAPLTLRIRYPSSFSLDVHGAVKRASLPQSTPDWQLHDVVSMPGSRVSGTFKTESLLIQHGGPWVGAGASRINASVPWRATFAAGYELGVSDWMVTSVEVDSDFQQRLALTPAVEVASPYIRLPFPSLSVGVGVPVEVFAQVAVGLRGQASLSFPFVGLVAWIDWYPARGEAVPVLLVRASL